jgi:two-component system repressor protein LuxO
MDLSLQAKLLRLFQNGRVRRLGATCEEKVDVRIICATNRNPRNELLAGRFREDLYYRLHVIPIEMPPLRERDNDAVELARVFVAEYAAEEKQMDMRLSPCAERAIAEYPWPGNVRQLQNVLRSAVVLNDTEVLTAEAFPELARPRPVSAANITGEQRPEAPVLQIHRDLSLGQARSLADVERYAIERSMRLHNNNIARAAAALNISPSTIYRKLQAWNKTADAPG